MKITIDTETHKITEKLTRTERKDKTGREVTRAQAVEALLIGFAVSMFTHDDVREAYIDRVATEAKKYMKSAYTEEE